MPCRSVDLLGVDSARRVEFLWFIPEGGVRLLLSTATEAGTARTSAWGSQAVRLTIYKILVLRFSLWC